MKFQDQHLQLAAVPVAAASSRQLRGGFGGGQQRGCAWEKSWESHGSRQIFRYQSGNL